MKKLITLSFICVTGLIACTKKVVPTTQATPAVKNETVGNEAKSAAQIQADIEAKKKIEAEETKTWTPVMTETENGRIIFTTKCTKCHEMKKTGNYTIVQWDNILRSMVPKAKLSADEEKQVTAYIKANAKQ